MECADIKRRFENVSQKASNLSHLYKRQKQKLEQLEALVQQEAQEKIRSPEPFTSPQPDHRDGCGTEVLGKQVIELTEKLTEVRSEIDRMRMVTAMEPIGSNMHHRTPIQGFRCAVSYQTEAPNALRSCGGSTDNMAYGMVIQSRVKKAVSTCDSQVVSCPDIELGGDKAVSKVLIQEGLTSNDVTPPFDPNHEELIKLKATLTNELEKLESAKVRALEVDLWKAQQRISRERNHREALTDKLKSFKEQVSELHKANKRLELKAQDAQQLQDKLEEVRRSKVAAESRAEKMELKLANEQREKYHLRKEVFELNASLETALEEKKTLAESNNKLEEKIKDLESKLAETTSALQEASVVKQSRQKRSLSVDAAQPSVSPQDTESSHSPVQQYELLPQQVEVLLSGVQEELNNIKQYMERFDPAKAPETHVPAHHQQGIPDLNNLAEFIKAWKSLKELMCDDEGQVAKSSLHQPQQKTDKKDLGTVGGPQDTDSVAKILAENLKLRNQLLLTQNNSVAGILSREREWFKQQICNLAKEIKTNSKDVCEQQDGRTREETNQCSLDKLQHSAKSSPLRDSRSSPFDTNRGAGEKDGVSLEMFVTPPSLLSPRIEAGVQATAAGMVSRLGTSSHPQRPRPAVQTQSATSLAILQPRRHATPSLRRSATTATATVT
jgi:hypothetical protein